MAGSPRAPNGWRDAFRINCNRNPSGNDVRLRQRRAWFSVSLIGNGAIYQVIDIT